MTYQPRYLAYCKFMGVLPELKGDSDGGNRHYMEWVSHYANVFESETGSKVALNQDAFTEFLNNLTKN